MAIGINHFDFQNKVSAGKKKKLLGKSKIMLGKIQRSYLPKGDDWDKLAFYEDLIPFSALLSNRNIEIL